jgi:phospholipid transport system substrate-binding protein
MLRSFFLIFFITAFSILSPPPGFAADVSSSQAHEQALQSPVGKFVQDLGDRVIKIISNKQLSTEQRDAEFNHVLGDSFDLNTIGRFVIGRAWNTATPDQQNEYMASFKALMIRNYGNRMTLVTGEGFQVIGTRPESDLDTVVSSQITHPDGSQATSIDWRVRQKDSKIGIIDVVVQGISLSVTQRQEYAAIIQNNGGQIDGLLEAMRNQLKGPTASANAVK